MAFLFAIPAFLSLLVLAAHFLRMGFMPLVLGTLGMALLLWFRRNWITRIAQVYLLLAALEWLRAMMAIIDARKAMDEPWKRAAVIMLSVEAFTVMSAVLLQWFVRRRPQAQTKP